MTANSDNFKSCPLCNSERIHKLGDIVYHQPTYFSTSIITLEIIPELWMCHQCNSSFVQNRVPENIAIGLYSQGKSGDRWSREPFEHQKSANQLECLERYFLKGKKILDIGCNTGELLDYAKSLSCETSGVEYSKKSREILRDKGHVPFSSISEVNQKFDVITAFDLVEHLYDLPAFFSSCKNLLNQDGVLIALTGNIKSMNARFCKTKWWYIRYPEHIVFPSKKYIIQHSGFLIEEWIRTYASNGYRHTSLQVIKGLILSLLRRNYDGLPSVGPDHILMVLKCED